MRKLLALLIVFALTAGRAYAFDNPVDFVGKFYFSIPFGAPTKREAMPHFGFGVGYDFGHENELIPDRFHAPPPINLFDWRYDLDGQTSIWLNGVDVAQISDKFNAAEDDAETQTALIVLGVVAVAVVGVIVYVEYERRRCSSRVNGECQGIF